MSEELTPAIPCPFCHAIPGINDVIGEYNEGCLYVRLRCPNGDEECMAEGPWENVIEDNISPEGLYELAVARWNQRYEPSELPEWVIKEIFGIRRSIEYSRYGDLKFDLCYDSETFLAVRAGIIKYLTLAMCVKKGDHE